MIILVFYRNKILKYIVNVKYYTENCYWASNGTIVKSKEETTYRGLNYILRDHICFTVNLPEDDEFVRGCFNQMLLLSNKNTDLFYENIIFDNKQLTCYVTRWTIHSNTTTKLSLSLIVLLVLLCTIINSNAKFNLIYKTNMYNYTKHACCCIRKLTPVSTATQEATSC